MGLRQWQLPCIIKKIPYLLEIEVGLLHIVASNKE